MGLIKEFKEFALRGNVVDMAVGIIIGGAFGAIVTSLVKDVMLPVLSLPTEGIDFSEFVVPLQKGADGKVLVGAKVGLFLNAVISFLITAFAVFMMIKVMNRIVKKKEEAPSAPPEPPAQEKLLTEIRDLLKQRTS